MAKRGRPCSFDRDDALRRALDVFWDMGYEGATMTALKDAMGGICAPSVYAAYGSKEALFRSALALYHAQESEALWQGLDTSPVRDAIGGLLRTAALRYSTPGKPPGCLVDLSTLNFSPANKAIETTLRDLRVHVACTIEARLCRARDDGELGTKADPVAVAAFYTTVLQGLSIQARDGASRDRLLAIVDGAMTAWDCLVGN